MLKGSAMGIAEVIPGVSGGTIAFISGIYETLLLSIKSIDFSLFKMVFTGKFKEAWDKVNGWFLLSLGAGMAGGLVFGIFAITYLMKYYPEPLWGFFFGLVIASAILISKQIKTWNATNILALLSGIGLALYISLVSPAEGSTHPLYIFISGVIAISAFILPGVSGSFMLLLMGMYTLVIPAIKSIIVHHDSESIYIVSVFAIGCLVGITTFSRVLTWLFEHYKDATFVVLTGFLIGSLYKIWPWRNIDQVVDKQTGSLAKVTNLEQFSALDIEHIKILKEVNVLPSDYWVSSPKVIITLLCILIGFMTVWVMEKQTNKTP